MKIDANLTDLAILQALGERLAARRIAMGMTQAEADEQVGVSERTLERLEAGDARQSQDVVRVLRVLLLLDGLEAMLPSAGPGTLGVQRREGRTRQRAPRAGVP